MKLFGGFHGNRTKNTRHPLPEETKEPGLRETPPAPRPPMKEPEQPEPVSKKEEEPRQPAEPKREAPAEPKEAEEKAEAAEATEAEPVKETAAETGGELENTAVFLPKGEEDGGPAPSEAEPEVEEPTEKTIVFRTPEEEAEIEEIIAAYQKKKRRRRIIVLAVLAVLIAGGVILWKSLVKPPEIVQPTARPTAQPTAAPTASAKPLDPDVTATPAPTPEVTPPPARMRRENVYTFMMIGRDQNLGNTDTIMAGVFDVNAGTVDVVSIPRDTCANVDSDPSKAETKKISGVYSRAGFDGLRDAVSDMMGFPIDCYVSVNINGFIQLVNTIGGVYFDVPYYMNYDDPTQNLHIHFSPGYQYLDGYDAIKVVRWRQNNDGTNYGDIARINTQQAFLKTVVKQCLSLPNLVSSLDDYISILQENMKTDLTTGNMTWFAKEFLKLDTENIRFHTMPSNYNDWIAGFSYGTVLVDEWLEMLNEDLNPYDQPITVDDVDLVYRDENGELCATGGEIRGGMDSFLTMERYLQMLREWNEYQESQNKKNEASDESSDSAPPAESAGEEADTNGGE